MPLPNTAAPHAEDQQPNEAINKRRNIMPPMIKTVAPPRPKGKSRGGFSRGWRGDLKLPQRTNLGWKKHGMAADPRTPTISLARCPDLSSPGTSHHHDSQFPPNPSLFSMRRDRYPSSSQQGVSGQVSGCVETAPFAHGASSRQSSGHVHSGVVSQPKGTRIDRTPSPKRRCLDRVDTPNLPIPEPAFIPDRSPRQSASGPSHSRSPTPLLPVRVESESQTPVTTAPAHTYHIAVSGEDSTPKVHPPVGVVVVKPERSPSPSLQFPSCEAPTLVKEGCTRYAPVPADCRKSDPSCVANRKLWVRREVGVLKQLGIEKERCFFRDDGMVIEWRSEVPVNANALVFRIQERHAENLRMGFDPIGISTKPKMQRKKDTLSFKSNNVEGLSAASAIFINEGDEELEAEMAVRPQRSNQGFPNSFSGQNESFASALIQPQIRSGGHAVEPTQAVQLFYTGEPLSCGPIQAQGIVSFRPSALQYAGLYIHRYMTTFDLNRMSLVEAYAPNAVFSCRSLSNATDPASFVGALHRQNEPHGQHEVDRCIHQGHLSVLTAILQLGSYVFGHQLPTLDVTQLRQPTLSESNESHIIFFTCETTMNMAQGGGSPLFIVRHSVLIKKGDSAKQWPYVALNHQMLAHVMEPEYA